jgi:hypothetical protein
MYHNIHVSRSLPTHDYDKNYDIESKVDNVIKSKSDQTNIVKRVQNTNFLMLILQRK